MNLAFLNEEGMRLFGHIFPDGQVPVKHILTPRLHVKGYDGLVYLVDWTKLDTSQQCQLTDFFVQNRGMTRNEFASLLAESHLTIPLRTSLVRGAASDTILRHAL